MNSSCGEMTSDQFVACYNVSQLLIEQARGFIHLGWQLAAV